MMTTLNTSIQEIYDLANASLPERKMTEVMSYEAHMGIGVFLVLAGVFGGVGNLMVVVMFVTDRQLTTAVDLLLLNLAITDLGMCGFCFPFVSSSTFAQRWLYGQVGCTLYGYMGFMFGNAATCNLTVISVQRYLVVCKRHSNNRSQKTHMAVAFIWLQATAWSSLPLLLPAPYALEPFMTSCTVAWASADRETRFFIYSIVLWTIANFAIVTGCYMKIYLISRREVVSTSSRSHKNLLVSKICFVLVVAFLLCWAPYTVFSLWLPTSSVSIPPLLTTIPVIFAKISSCINPLLYILVSERFRQKFLALLVCRKNSSLNIQSPCPNTAEFEMQSVFVM